MHDGLPDMGRSFDLHGKDDDLTTDFGCMRVDGLYYFGVEGKLWEGR